MTKGVEQGAPGGRPPASAVPGASCSAIPAVIDERDELIAALKAELGAYQAESQWMKKLKETARAWTDAKAPREYFAAQRVIVELRREIKVLKKQVAELMQNANAGARSGQP